jgi:hypothetical protein
VSTVRLLPRINLKREVWPGGPKVGDVLEAQLSPRPSTDPGARLTGSTDQTQSHDPVAVDLLLLLQ